jgi:hypothetical protein
LLSAGPAGSKVGTQRLRRTPCSVLAHFARAAKDLETWLATPICARQRRAANAQDAHVAERRTHAAVDDQGDGEVAARICPGAGSAETEMTERIARYTARRGNAVVSQPPAHVEGNDQASRRFLLPFRGAGEGGSREQADAVDFASSRQSGVHSGTISEIAYPEQHKFLVYPI